MLATLLILGIIPGGQSCKAQTVADAKKAISVALSKDAYWYSTGEIAYLSITVDNGGPSEIKNAEIRSRVHYRNGSREDLDDRKDGTIQRGVLQAERYGKVTLKPGANRFTYRLALDKNSRYPQGVYPLSVDLFVSGETVSTVLSEIIIMDPPTLVNAVNPLRMAWVFKTIDRGYCDADGTFKSNELPNLCSTSDSSPGWLWVLMTELSKWQGHAFNILCSPLLLENIDEISQGYTVKLGDSTRRYRDDSQQSQDARAVISMLKEMSNSGRFQILTEPYAGPDLEALNEIGWKEDANEQIRLGKEVVKRILETDLSDDYCCPSRLRMNTELLESFNGQMGSFFLLSSDLLERNSQGKKLLAGSTLAAPVLLENDSVRHSQYALFTDSRMQRLLETVEGSGDPHGVAQLILAELTNLYLENPAANRTVAICPSGTWQPSRSVLDELLKAIDGAPWLKGVTLAEGFAAVPVVNKTALEIPPQELSKPALNYFTQLSGARLRLHRFEKATNHNSPFLQPLKKAFYTSQSDIWRQLRRNTEGIRYANYITKTVDQEFEKVRIATAGSVTLTSDHGSIPLSVLNDTGYRLQVVLSCSSNGLDIAKPDQEVIIDPKENLIEVPVAVTKKGKVSFSVELKVDGVVIDEALLTVRTSRFNRFAMIFVGILLIIIGFVWLIKRRPETHNTVKEQDLETAPSRKRFGGKRDADQRTEGHEGEGPKGD